MHRAGFIIFPGFQVMSLAVVSAFEMANVVLGEPFYDITLLSEHGGAVCSSAGFKLETEPFDGTAWDSLIVGAATFIQPASPGLLEFVRRAALTTRRIAGPCTGAFTLAEAGLLDGRQATTHWFFARDLQKRFPAVRLEEDRIFIVDGNVWTSAGMTAVIDLALAMIEKDLGHEVAQGVAKSLVVYHRRTGGQSQFSALSKLRPKSDRIQKALDYAKKNLCNRLSVEELAEAASLSARQFSRAFSAETGQSPAKAVESLRLEAARLLIEKGRLSMDHIAVETGFLDRERMRKAFLRVFGQSPQTLRRASRIDLQLNAEHAEL
ncbi:GlxA family transcriptional regulator [Pseudomonas alloputida]|uniref:HTH-type transcriptional regulator CdhR n=2 Tax=Pseudomonas TaxID=286 RepID=A0A109KG84_PSEFL|nr:MULTISPECIES: GlxA family transcriptional regulator [Pseudomonas]KWV68640.1 HTH-type transcriptional regulator CdhR [Pseudomonas fluorescens]MBN0551563.1 GlxA family transcriptional regulator [Pseudomonas aeruginosa]MCE0975653.1 GlxA family transcriptional regulator [Pseudomonas putida]MDM3950783.1 GlxA family transcriptional regulator [Pseudomonas alloputida]